MKIDLRKSVIIFITLCLILLVSCNNQNYKETILKINYNPTPKNIYESKEGELLTRSIPWPNYSVLENIESDLIKEIEANIVLEDNSIPLVKEVSNGYIIGVMEIDSTKESSSPKNTSPYKNPVLYKIGKDGKVLWKQTYDLSSQYGNMTNLLTYDDGRILFSISNWPKVSMGSPADQQSYLIQCDKKGNELWKKGYDDYIASLFKYIFLTEDEKIIGVGEWFISDGQPTLSHDSHSDIVVTYFDDNGTIINQKSFGGKDYENCKGAIYDQSVGIVISGWTFSKKGDFVTKYSDRRYIDYIACIDESLNLKWVKHPNEDERYSHDQMVVKDNMIYAVGKPYDEASTDGGIYAKFVFWQKLNKDGEEILKQYYKESMQGLAKLCVLENNYVVVGIGDQNQGKLIIYDDKGEKIHIIYNLMYEPHEIIATVDQGFIVKSIRKVRTLPQPAYLSTTWIDKEVAIMKYDSNYDLEWRKIYDDYKDEIRVDFVLPLRN